MSGKAGKFNFIPFFTTIGSGIGLLSIATLVADCLLLNLTKKRKFYQKLTAPETDNEEEENEEEGVKIELNQLSEANRRSSRPAANSEKEENSTKKNDDNKNLNDVYCYRI